MIELIAEPQIIKTWEQFVKENPSYSIALDGYVSGPPMYDDKGPKLNLNHHEGIYRLATRSVSAQAYLSIKVGLIDKFRENNEERVNIYVNDPDQDVCLAVWLLRNYKKISKPREEPLVERLVEIEDKLDTTAGTYPINPESDIMKKIAWVFKPYTDARFAGNLEKMNSIDMKNLIDKVSNRIDYYFSGKCEKLEPDTRYEKVYKGKNWIMVNEIGAHARTKLFWDGVKAFVSVKERQDGNYNYILGKMSPFIPFPIEMFYKELNTIEGLLNDIDRWGGSDTIGGSPRQKGSRIKPKELRKLIDTLIR